MRKPGSGRPSGSPTKKPASTPLPIGEIATSVGGAVTSVADAYAEHQRTKQIVAQADRDKALAVEETRRVLGDIDARRQAMQVQDNMHARDHEYRMAELQVRAEENADARAQRLQRVEKVIGEVIEQLPAPRGRLLK
jgi:hypothetical protein